MDANEMANWPQLLRIAALDIERFIAGHIPTDDELLARPGIQLWALDQTNGQIIWGLRVKPHELNSALGLPDYFSLQYFAIDSDQRWVLTVSGYYRLIDSRGSERVLP